MTICKGEDMKDNSTIMGNIAPCPHCGGFASLTAECSCGGEWRVFVRCNICEARGKSFKCQNGEPSKDNEEEYASNRAIKAWNMRAK